MYQKGHYGVSLLVFAPIGFALVVLGVPSLAYLTGAVMVGLAMLPDSDQRIPGLPHRGPTHSLLFAAVLGLLFAGVGYLVTTRLGIVSQISLILYGFFLGSITVIAHLLGDLLTPMGVAPFWPLSSKRYSLSLTRADNTVWNYLLFALGVFATAGAMVLALRMA